MAELMRLDGNVARVEVLDSKNGKRYQKFTIDTGKEHKVLMNWGKIEKAHEGDDVKMFYEPGDKFPGRIKTITVTKPAGTEPEGEQETLDEVEALNTTNNKPRNGNLANSKAYLAMKLASEMVQGLDASTIEERCKDFKALTNQAIILFTEYGE